jgi:nucleotide-binding universal stress UspA family protein
MHIVCPFDNSSTSRFALCEALETAQRKQATLTVLYAVDEWRLDVAAPEPITRGRDREYEHGLWVLEQAEELARTFDYPIETELVEGRPADAISEYCEQEQPDVIMLGTRSAEDRKASFVSSVSESLRKLCECPTRLVHYNEPPQS